MSSPQDDCVLYPLQFAPLLLDKPWGGQRLEELLGRERPHTRSIGEAWLIWQDLIVANGAYRGRSLGDLARSCPHELLGPDGAVGQGDHFPLLTKLIDARQVLSIQVHPDDDAARCNDGEPQGKYEMWYVVEAEPGATVIHGLQRHVDRDELRQAIEDGTVPEILDEFEVRAGDVILNAPGTIHALGAGILVFELQQSSDLTYRLYDWGRTSDNGQPRELHLDKGIGVAHLDPLQIHKVRPVSVAECGVVRTYLGACRHFAAEMLEVESQITEQPAGRRFHALTILQGACRLLSSSSTEVLNLEPGDSVLVPAAVHEYSLQAVRRPLRVVKAYVPHLLQDIVAPLLDKGIAGERIVQLGGDPQLSDLAAHLSC